MRVYVILKEGSEEVETYGYSTLDIYAEPMQAARRAVEKKARIGVADLKVLRVMDPGDMLKRLAEALAQEET